MKWKPRAVAVGAVADAAIAVLAVTFTLPESARWAAFAGVVAAGLFGGHLAGRLAGGPWRRRVGHGLLAGVFGGVAFAVAVRWSLQPGTPSGALWPVNYLLATGARRVPSGLAARYDTLVGVAAALVCGGLYVAEGALAGGAAPGGDTEMAIRE